MEISSNTIAEQVAILRQQVLNGSNHVELLKTHPYPTPNQKRVLAEYLKLYCS